MRRPKKQRRDGHTAESRLVAVITLKEQCGPELAKVLKLIGSRQFAVDIKKQNEVSLILRGMAIKVQAYKAERQETDEAFIEIIQGLVRQFGGAWERQSLNLLISNPDGGPIPIDARISGSMNLSALEQAIAKDQER